MEPLVKKNEYKTGLIAVIESQLIWGSLPIYWHMLVPISSFTIIFYRIFLVAVSAVILAKMKYSWEEILEPLKNKKTVFRYFAAGLVITVNWSIYIWAVTIDEVIQTAIGYYLNPIMICVFGMIIFHENLTKYKAAAFIMALISVVIILIHFGQIPGIALMLAFTFSIYTAMKKGVKQPYEIALIYETVFLAPFAFAVAMYKELNGTGALSTGEPYQYVLLLLCGIATVVPLALFSKAVSKTSMFLIGLAAYISPTINLIIGIFYFKEAFDLVQLEAFVIIWIGLLIFSIGEWKAYRKNFKRI